MNHETERAELLTALEHAPKDAACNPEIHGWWTPSQNYLHAICAARIMARGCRIPAGSAPVWAGDKTEIGKCICGN